MSNVEITDGRGRQLRSGAPLFDAKEIADAESRAIERSIRSFRCPEHGERPRVVRRRGRESGVELQACCEAMVAKAEAAIERG
jgi:hypothetical protein